MFYFSCLYYTIFYILLANDQIKFIISTKKPINRKGLKGFYLGNETVQKKPKWELDTQFF